MKIHTLYTKILQLALFLPVFLCFSSCSQYSVFEITIEHFHTDYDKGRRNIKRNPDIDYAPCFHGVDILAEGTTISESEFYEKEHYESVHFLVNYKNVRYLLDMSDVRSRFMLLRELPYTDPVERPMSGELIRYFDSPRLYVCLESKLLESQQTIKPKL